jgi:hypothetical protein
MDGEMGLTPEELAGMTPEELAELRRIYAEGQAAGYAPGRGLRTRTGWPDSIVRLLSLDVSKLMGT